MADIREMYETHRRKGIEDLNNVMATLEGPTKALGKLTGGSGGSLPRVRPDFGEWTNKAEQDKKQAEISRQMREREAQAEKLRKPMASYEKKKK